MRKVLLLCAAMAVLLIGSVSLGVAVARTGAPVLYDARVQPGAVDELDPETGTGPRVPGADAGDTSGAGEASAGDDDAGARGADAPGGPGDPGSGRGPTERVPRHSTTPEPNDPAPSPGTSPDEPGDETPPPADPVPTAEEQAAWLSFQQLVRDCMTSAGFEYRHWKWWEAESPDPESLAPAMPDDLTEPGQAAWREALYGTEGGEGCLVAAVEHDQEESATPPPSDAPDAGAPDGESSGAEAPQGAEGVEG